MCSEVVCLQCVGSNVPRCIDCVDRFVIIGNFVGSTRHRTHYQRLCAPTASIISSCRGGSHLLGLAGSANAGGGV